MFHLFIHLFFFVSALLRNCFLCWDHVTGDYSTLDATLLSSSRVDTDSECKSRRVIRCEPWRGWTRRKFYGLRLETHKFEKRRRRDSNSGPLDHRADALPTRLPCFGNHATNYTLKHWLDNY